MTKLPGAAVAAVVLAVAVAAGCDASGDTPGIIVLPGMVYTVPFDPYDPNPLTPNGANLMLPPEGAVHTDGVDYYFPYGPEREEADRAGLELVNPIEPTPEALARGKKVFETFCIVCHGAAGMGGGPIIPRFPNPPPLQVRAKGLPDGALYHIITMGQGLMASYALQLFPEDRWKVIHYVRFLQGIDRVAMARGEVPTAADAAGTGTDAGESASAPAPADPPAGEEVP